MPSSLNWPLSFTITLPCGYGILLKSSDPWFHLIRSELKLDFEVFQSSDSENGCIVHMKYVTQLINHR